MLRTKEATRLAREFMRHMPDVPALAFAMPRKYLPEEHGRMYETRYFDIPTNTEYTLLTFIVKDDGTIVPKDDRRDRVKAELSKKGASLPTTSHASETAIMHLQRAIEEPNVMWPEWFVRIRLSEPSDGEIDALATLAKENGTHVHVPVVVFRKNSDKAKFFKGSDDDPNTRVGLVIPPGLSLDGVRSKLIAQLGTARKRFLTPQQ